ncbi:MAG: DUF4159 domain-containing protein, partial [Planctomycetota bacterium]
AQHLKLQYRSVDLNLNTFSGDPSEMPVLFFSGGRTLRLPDEQIATLRKYVLSGGMVWMDSVAGSPFFYNGCVEMLKKAFPEETLRRIPLDHPLFHMIVDMEKANLPAVTGAKEPVLEGIFVGCRVGVAVSKYGLGCGWDNFTPDYSIKQSLYYTIQDATMIGLNMVSYAVGYAELGKAHSRPELFGEGDRKAPTNEFVFAQVKHNGVWNTDPGGPENLLRTLARDTNVKVTFRRKTVDPASDSLKDVQFLYMSGCHDMVLSSAAVETLRSFLGRGGTLFIDNSEGLKTFDIAVRREMRKVTPAVQRLDPKLETPQLEGLQLDGDLRVIYSKYDLGGGWQADEHAQAKGYAVADAMRLGVNVVTYAMTH